MSAASSKSKSKDKKSGKEAPGPAVKPSAGAANAGSGIPASAYNPLLGTFHTLELSQTSSATAIHNNSRFQNIDETDDHSGGSVAAGAEYDSVSNNDSCSSESEEHKDKTSNPLVKAEIAVPGADNDKREKIRQKNERKHQRQKERRAQELHERCSSYIVSRKLEALAQQLVAMGFEPDKSEAALIQFEGRLEESVSWLLSDPAKPRDQNIGGATVKIDISEELAQIAELEARFKCSKQEVERAIVACEGDLRKAAESLRVAKQDPLSISLKPEETGDPPTASNGKFPVTVNQNMRPQVKSNPPPIIQQRRDDKDFNYTKQGGTAGGPVDSTNKPLQPLKRGHPKLEWVKGQPTPVPAERRWSSAGSNPSVSHSLASPLQAPSPPVKTEARYVAVGGDLKNLQPGTVREPVIMMQRPQSVNTKQVPAASMSSSPPGTATNWYPSTSVELMRSSGFLPQIPSSTSLSTSNLGSTQMFHQFQYQQQQQQHQHQHQHQQQHQHQHQHQQQHQHQHQPQQQHQHQHQPQHQHFIPGGPGDSAGTSRGNNLWNRAGASQTLAAASSLGLFSGLGSAGSSGASSPVDWSAGGGSYRHFDYTNIDWSLDRGVTPSTRPNGLWTGMPSVMKSNTNFYDSKPTGLGAQSGMRPAPSNRNGVSLVGLQDGVGNADASGAGFGEWTSPFEGVDLFRIPRQFVSSSP